VELDPAAGLFLEAALVRGVLLFGIAVVVGAAEFGDQREILRFRSG
jgi:hypothetical protein